MSLNMISIFEMFFILTLSANSLADPIPYKDCGSTKNVVVNLFDISNCSVFPCLFHKNSNITLNLNFTTKAEYGSLTNQLFGTIAGVKVPFPLPDNEKSACSNGIKCPLVANQNFYQIISIPILSSYPDLSVFVTVELVDQDSRPFICALFPAKIVG